MRRSIWIMFLIAGSALVGCTGEDAGPRIAPGSGTEGDAVAYAQARDEWELKSEQGDARSQRHRGMMYFLGQGIDRDYAKAFEWFDKAAVQGEDMAQLCLGIMYAEGHGVPQSNVQAYMWYSLSDEQGNPGAGHRLEKLAGLMTSTEIAEAQKLADEWTPTL